ncbi:DUF4870 domain-containing protein [Larkinella rosea]|uniref:DUF4870 domain-containing protein n=1 Tax=Larkinella rosea TaxID=2025312 RepID=A0A3P1BZ55_9BACT|nr:DUF4870 domain-containing protein [Larkinella rosea]RRB06415.1 DUF4870 domain-containing protein [Larkinella rosea]
MENQPYNNPPLPPSPTTSLSPSDERMWGLLAHLSSLAGFIIPFGNIIGPVVVWQIQKDKSAFVDYHGKEAVNFQITMAIAYCVAFLLIIIFIGIPILIVLGVLNIIFAVLAGIKANNGEYYQYPFAIRLIK